MKRILFVTGNNGKFEQVSRWVKELNPSIELEQINLDIPEYQSLDITYIASNKAAHAWEILKKPLVVDDFGVYLESFNQFPGPLAKFVYEGIGLEGFWKLAKENPKGSFASCFVYIDQNGKKNIFQGSSQGNFIELKKEVLDVDLPYTYIFVPNGTTKTLAQLKGTSDDKKFNHRFKAVEKWINSI